MTESEQIIKNESWGSNFALLRHPYTFSSEKLNKYHASGFETQILLKRTIVLRGADAAKIFYDNEKFQREGAMPRRLQKTLVGRGGVQGMDGVKHLKRKALFLSILSKEGIEPLVKDFDRTWGERIRNWSHQDEINLFDEVELLLASVVCNWAGIKLSGAEQGEMAKDLSRLIDGSGGLGYRYFQSRFARIKLETKIATLIEQERTKKGKTRRALSKIAFYEEDQLLSPRIAAVEVLNIIRPTVAIGRFIVFAALAIYKNPHVQKKLKDAQYRRWFVQEVRRFYPFFPFVVARVKRDFTWKDFEFKKGLQVLLDLYGTNHDPVLWQNPDQFNPERFRNWNGSPFDFIPQGGGDHLQHHRCAGEWLTIEIMDVAVRNLNQSMSYEVPEQDLSIDLTRAPTRPKSGFIMTKVKPH